MADDEALQLLRPELAAYRKQGDVGSSAITLERIVDSLTARGDLRQALRILADDLLARCCNLGDGEKTAVAAAKKWLRFAWSLKTSRLGRVGNRPPFRLADRRLSSESTRNPAKDIGRFPISLLS